MLRKRLGRSKLEIGVVGFGSWGIGGRTTGDTSYGDTDDEVSRAAIRRALELGVSFFDTAPAYGDGHSERLLGEVLTGTDGGAVVSTKVGYASWSDAPDFSPASVEASIVGSLDRLKRQRADVVWLHSPDGAMLSGSMDLFSHMDDLVGCGTVGLWGVSCKSPTDAMRILERRRVDTFQVNFNMLDIRAHDCGLLDLAASEEISVVARTPLCFGFLTGAVDQTTVFGEGDHRRAWSAAQIARWAEGARRAMAITGSVPGDEACVAALRFCLSFPAVTCVLPGALNPTEVEVQVRAGDLGPLPADQVEEVIALNRAEEFYVR